MAHDYTYFYSATRKYFCLGCGVATRQRQCEKCKRRTHFTGIRTICTDTKGRNKAKKRMVIGERVRNGILNHSQVRNGCGLHSSQHHRMVDATTKKCIICNIVVWKAKGLY